MKTPEPTIKTEPEPGNCTHCWHGEWTHKKKCCWCGKEVRRHGDHVAPTKDWFGKP